ncbi:sensor histidine kinase [Novosphingopyxis sp.]|uniref:sensor histidine kinase n=1 Tax=Novosphingopyxis sp. TaxID=2709690 RepID=UPI003B5AD54D
MFKVTARTVLELGSELISSDPIAFYELIKNGIDAGSKSGVTVEFDIVLARRDLEEAKAEIASAMRLAQVANEEDYGEPKTDGSDEDDGHVGDDENVGLEDEEESFEELRDRVANKLITEAEALWPTAHDLICKAADLEALAAALHEVDGMNSITVSDTGSGMSLEQLDTVFLVIGTTSRKTEIDAALATGSEESPFLGEKGIGRLSAMRLGDTLSVRTSQTGDTHYSTIDIDWSAFDDITKMIEDVEIEPKLGDEKDDPVSSGTDIVIRRLNADWSEKRVEWLATDDFSLLVNPLDKDKNQRIVVVWNGKRVPIQRLDESFLSHANAFVRGDYKMKPDGPQLELRMELINLGFEHPREVSIETAPTDVLLGALVGPKAKRKRMNKRDLDYTALDTVGSFKFELYWFNRSILRKHKSTGEYQALRNLLDQWMGVRLYRDGFRVYPYGAEDDDWLDLDKTALKSKGYALNRIQLIGQAQIGRVANPKLIDQTNREGLRQTPEEAILKETIQFSVERLRDEMNRITKEQKDAKPRFVTDETRTQDLEKRMKATIRSISRVVPEEHQDVVAELEMMREEFSRYASQARDRIADMEKDADQMLAMAGIGLMVEVVAHELTRSAEDALDILNGLKRKTVPLEVRQRLEGLRASMNSITKRLRILDPLSVTGRQRKERFKLDELVTEILDAHEVQFARHKVDLEVLQPDNSVTVQAVKGMVVQVLENLISNSLYWMDVEKQRKMSRPSKLTVIVEDNPPSVRLSDNGPGISSQYKDRVFDLFFSLKDKSRRRGLGLFIAREAAEHNGGSLILDADIINDEGRFTTFDYQVVGDRS